VEAWADCNRAWDYEHGSNQEGLVQEIFATVASSLRAPTMRTRSVPGVDVGNRLMPISFGTQVRKDASPALGRRFRSGMLRWFVSSGARRGFASNHVDGTTMLHPAEAS
jgi:hypothetical protein